ncbi:MAG: hypothetical protein FJZ01_08870 [Candidatus Sericytochromatia bacterium]|nr:hypothetical protein [Candidatus Tanganyikabacteria bacterium]
MSLTTAAHNDALPALDWYLMPEAFSAPLVDQAVAECGLGRDAVLLDPFSGTGTTALLAKLRGMRAVGVEANPFLAWAARAKLAVDTHPDLFETLRERVLDRVGDLADAPPADLPDLPRADTWIAPRVARKVVALREAIFQERPGPARDLLLLALAAILRPVGNLKLTAHAFGSAVPKEDAPVRELFEKKTDKMLRDLEAVDRTALGEAAILPGDARDLAALGSPPFGPADLAITSPPYLNNLDYTMQTRLELFFLGHVADLGDVRAIRKRMVVCDAKAMYKDIHDHELVADVPAIQAIADAIAERHKDKKWGWDYPFMTRQYFGGLHRVLAGARAWLKPGARFVLVVGESSHSGVKVPVPALLAELGERLGYVAEGVRVHRVRRSSSHRDGLEEASVILRR